MTSLAHSERKLAPWIGAACLLHLALAAAVTGWVLVDDAYITLRYARNAARGVGLVYNAGEPVFGVTSPLWGVVTAALFAVFGSATEVAITVGAVLLTGVSATMLARLLPARGRTLGVAIFLLAPAFVDNRLLGMETPLVVFLLLAALAAAVEGRLVRAAAWTGLLVVSRPEGLLFAPFLLAATARARGGWGSTLRDLLRPAPLAAALGPGLAWVAWASVRYGSIVPQSMVAKSGWNSAHYDGLFGLEGALLTIPRLTFLPFVDRFPGPWPIVAALAVVALVAQLVVVNVRRGGIVSRFGLASYGVYVGFFLVGKGATEASWYAVPSSVALLLAVGPALPTLRPSTLRAATAALVLAAFGLAVLRAPLLHSYVEGYGRCADALNELPGEPRVVVGEIGVFGYRSRLPVTDVGALVSPEVLAWKNAGLSFVALVRASGADLFVISEIALRTNHYPSVGPVWADGSERRWLDEACRIQCRYRDKIAFRLLPEVPRRALTDMRTFYRRSLLDRLTGRYTVEWENEDGPQSLTAHNRLTDLEGHLPSLASLMRLPQVASSYLAARRHPILPEPVPFLVWDAIRFLERTLRPGMRVLEIGSGNSTLWFLKRGCRVVSFEHSEDWARHVRGFVHESLDERYAGRLEQHVVAGDAAVQRIERLDDGFFDLALVDCMNAHTSRPDALRAARQKVAADGWMALDNSDHPQNWPALETMADRERLRFTGLAPMCAVICQTSLWQV